jgi:hypothetical protein
LSGSFFAGFGGVDLNVQPAARIVAATWASLVPELAPPPPLIDTTTTITATTPAPAAHAQRGTPPELFRVSTRRFGA